VGEPGEGRLQPLRGRGGHAALDLQEREEVLGLREGRVEGLRRDGQVAERRAAVRLVEDAPDTERERPPAGRLEPDRAADGEVMLLRVLVGEEDAVRAE